jgi:hypothetical protein
MRIGSVNAICTPAIRLPRGWAGRHAKHQTSESGRGEQFGTHVADAWEGHQDCGQRAADNETNSDLANLGRAIDTASGRNNNRETYRLIDDLLRKQSLACIRHSGEGS